MVFDLKLLYSQKIIPPAAKIRFGSRRNLQRPRKKNLEAARSSSGRENQIWKPQEVLAAL